MNMHPRELFSGRPSLATGYSDHGGKEIRWGGMALVGFFVIFLGWAAFAPLDAAVVAPGVVVVAGNRQAVQHRDGGVISRLAVREGQRVRQGDVLLELSTPEVSGREQALLSQVVDLQMQRARLNAEIANAGRLERPAEWASFSEADRAVAEEAYQRHEREAAALGRRGAWSEYGARIAGYRDEMAAVARQEQLLSDELEGMRALAAENFAPVTRVRALERALAEMQGRRGELRSSIAATQQQRSEQQRTVEARLAQLSPEFGAVREQLARTVVRAPAAGAVVGLTAHTVGGVVRPGETIMEIVPEGRDLVVEAQVRPEDADNLEVGQGAEVRVTAFSGRRLPILEGEIISVSADRFTDERSGAGYFRAQVRVPTEELERAASEGGSQLRPGLPAEVVAVTRKRTALEFMFEPLNQALWRSFREQ